MQVCLGISHTAAVTQSGDVISFGNNDFGQLGTGDNKSTEYASIVNLQGYRAIVSQRSSYISK